MTEPSPTGPFRDIAVVCDPDRDEGTVLARAAAMARAGGARLTVLAARDCASGIDSLARFAGVGRDKVAEQVRSDLHAGLVRMVEAHAGGIKADIVVRIGRPYREIIADVIDNRRDLLIKPAEPFDDRHHHLFTSTDQHLLRKSPCPVWLAVPEAPWPPASIIAAVDLDEDDMDAAAQRALNERIVRTALHLAAKGGATVHVTHVWEAPAEDIIHRWSSDPAQVSLYVDRIESARKRALDALLTAAAADLPDNVPAPRAHLARGMPRRIIPAHVDAIGADLLVMGTLARTGVPGLIIGNTAEDVLNAVDCSVLTVKPPGYVSPLAMPGSEAG